MDIYIDYAVKFLAMFVMALISLMIKRFQSYLVKKAAETADKELAGLITDFVAAAEQQYKASDPDGTKRLTYVEELIKTAGYQISDIIKAKIEAAVFSINQNNK